MFPHWHLFGSPQIRVLSRPKLSGVGFHVGLQLPDTSVAHLTDNGGAQHVSYAEFAQGRPVTVVRDVDSSMYVRVMNNVRAALSEQRPYHVTDWNCERFVNSLIDEKPESATVNGLVLIALIVGGLALLSRVAR